MKDNLYPTWVEINLSAIRSNTKHLIEMSQRPLMAVVKANAYGCGAVEVSKTALSAGASWLGVARYCEARVLREAGITAPILVFGPIMPNEIDEAIANHVTLTLYNFEIAALLAARAEAMGKPVEVHLKVDTGFGRLGIYNEDVLTIVKYVQQLGGIIMDGIFSHLAMAASVGHPHNASQIKRFTEAVNILKENGVLPKWIHLANSAATYYERESYFNMVRAGSAIIGLAFTSNLPFPSEMQPSFSWKARLVSCKVIPKGWGIGYGQTYSLKEDEIIGVIPVGYGDCYRRKFGNHVLIGGIKVPVVGVECMDLTMIKLPHKFPLGTEVVLIGTQGNEAIYVEDICQTWNTLELDVTTNVSERVPRIYVNT